MAMALAEKGKDYPFAYNRKEKKDHGEGGSIVGDLSGRVLVVDDVITAGTAIRESWALIKASGASIGGVLIALDRQEIGANGKATLLEIEEEFKCPVLSIVNLEMITEYLRDKGGYEEHLARIEAYRREFGAKK